MPSKPPAKKAKAPGGFLFLTAFRPEMMSKIIEEVGPYDWLALKLTCKAMASIMPGKVQPRIQEATQNDEATHGVPFVRLLAKDRVTQALMRIENDDKKRAIMKFLTCSGCSTLKPKSKFIDSQRKKAESSPWTISNERVTPGNRRSLRRCCIPCAAEYYYSQRPYVRIDGLKSWVCFECSSVHLCDAPNDDYLLRSGPGSADKVGKLCHADTTAGSSAAIKARLKSNV